VIGAWPTVYCTELIVAKNWVEASEPKPEAVRVKVSVPVPVVLELLMVVLIELVVIVVVVVEVGEALMYAHCVDVWLWMTSVLFAGNHWLLATEPNVTYSS